MAVDTGSEGDAPSAPPPAVGPGGVGKRGERLRKGGKNKAIPEDSTPPSKSEPHWVTAALQSHDFWNMKMRNGRFGRAVTRRLRPEAARIFADSKPFARRRGADAPNDRVDVGPSGDVRRLARVPRPSGPNTVDVKDGRFPFGWTDELCGSGDFPLSVDMGRTPCLPVFAAETAILYDGGGMEARDRAGAGRLPALDYQ